MSELQILTNSRLKSFRACQRRHRYAYTLGYRPVRTSEALAFGTAMHKALECYWTWRSGLGVVIDVQAEASSAFDSLDLFARSRARALFSGYTAAWHSDRLTVLAVERQFSLPLINPETGAKSRTWQLGGKLDLLARLADGRIAIIEHKTTSEDAAEGSTYRERLTLDGQVSQYFEGADSLAQQYGFERCDVVLYDVLTKPALRPLKATLRRPIDETPEEYELRCMEAIAADPSRYYHRAEVVRLESERDEYQFDVWQLADAIRNSERTEKAPRNPDSCFQYGRPCEFWPVCSGRASLDDPGMYRKAENVNEELTNAA
jgi:hypothetical protein